MDDIDYFPIAIISPVIAILIPVSIFIIIPVSVIISTFINFILSQDITNPILLYLVPFIFCFLLSYYYIRHPEEVNSRTNQIYNKMLKIFIVAIMFILVFLILLCVIVLFILFFNNRFQIEQPESQVTVFTINLVLTLPAFAYGLKKFSIISAELQIPSHIPILNKISITEPRRKMFGFVSSLIFDTVSLYSYFLVIVIFIYININPELSNEISLPGMFFILFGLFFMFLGLYEDRRFIK